MSEPTINADWHAAHKMPVHPTDEQRVAWHLEHTQHCGCRPIPARVLEMMARLEAAQPPSPLSEVAITAPPAL